VNVKFVMFNVNHVVGQYLNVMNAQILIEMKIITVNVKMDIILILENHNV